MPGAARGDLSKRKTAPEIRFDSFFLIDIFDVLLISYPSSKEPRPSNFHLRDVHL